jgi:hypothetical protein
MGIIGSIVGGIMGSNAATDASNAEQQGANKALGVEQQNQKNAQDFQNGVWTGTKTAEQPYQDLGSTSANSLKNLLSKGFQAPTLADAENTPGYQFTLQQGTDAINKNAAANGTLFSGNTGKALTDYGQGLASTTYQQDYNNALNTYMSNYSSLLGGTSTGLSSTGQLGQFGQEASNTMANVDLTGGQQQAQQINNAAAARASGYLGRNQAWQKTLGDIQGGVGNVDFSGGSSPLEMASQFAFA